MEVNEVLAELQALGKERTKKMYMSNGAVEPLYGVATGAMKSLKRAIKLNQPLAEQLYATGNYDAMYFAGVIAEPKKMTAEDFERWIEDAYFYMLSDYVVAVTLAESPIAQQVADAWIASGEDLKMSAGWSCYCWLLGNQKDDKFDQQKLFEMLKMVQSTIHQALPRTQASMNNFLYTTAISYVPLHEQATQIAKEMGPIIMQREGKALTSLHAYANIVKDVEKGRVGFKRKYVRC